VIRLVILLSVLLVLGQVFAQEDPALIWRLSSDSNDDSFILENCPTCKKDESRQIPLIIGGDNLGNMEELRNGLERMSREDIERFSKTGYERRLDRRRRNRKQGCYYEGLKRVCPGLEIKLKPFKGAIKATKKF